MHRRDFPCQHHLFCMGDTPEQAVLWDPHGPLWILNHGHAEDRKGQPLPQPGRRGPGGPVLARSGKDKTGRAQAIGQNPGAAAGSAGQRRSAAAGGRIQEEVSARCHRRLCPGPAMRSRHRRARATSFTEIAIAGLIFMLF